MHARIADSGVPRREHQGPRPSVTIAEIEAIQSAHGLGVPVADLAAAHRVTVRSIYRYLAKPGDPLARAIADSLRVAMHDLGVATDHVDDMAGELARVLRRRGWIDEGGH